MKSHCKVSHQKFVCACVYDTHTHAHLDDFSILQPFWLVMRNILEGSDSSRFWTKRSVFSY